MYWPNVKSVPLPVSEIIGVPQKSGQSLDTPSRPRSLFCKIFNGLLLGWTLLLFWPNLKFVALLISEIIVIGVWVGTGVANPNLWEEQDVGGREWYRWKERW